MNARSQPPAKRRRSVNLSLDEAVVAEAREYGISLSRTSEAALAKAVKEERWRRWQEENRDAIEANNRWVEENGIPYADLRLW
ncbi:type II toxin-antitoxin system CcdA family antitoxin [Sphingomonas immobilis]|uniref:Type II toxin-antitoxin system CcdA family antitoxin n=1 Tax=Sphingomonas immobilis TaxID=3063997 RepID=A0ABT8ZWQ3_9SPHN|nr:type II toxin-antitoxin system CcdA family antitoxin [Sphingomonas sp. CA1-15]MDO7841564.1 type II toxin-antitoxin system CcdA family antitoxin [Sphingomonas sp. CA1-15]